MDIKNLFKRKAAPNQPSVGKHTGSYRHAASTRRTQLIGLVVVLLLVLGAGSYVLVPEVSTQVDDLLGLSTPPLPSATPTPPIRKRVIASQAIALPAMSGIDAISAVETTSAIPSLASPLAGSSVLAASTVIAQPDPVIAIPETTESSEFASSSVPPQKQHAGSYNRPHNRDIRHCLELKTNEAIMRCAYPKR